MKYTRVCQVLQYYCKLRHNSVALRSLWWRTTLDWDMLRLLDTLSDLEHRCRTRGFLAYLTWSSGFLHLKPNIFTHLVYVIINCTFTFCKTNVFCLLPQCYTLWVWTEPEVFSIIQGFQTLVLIFIIIFTTFWLICPAAFFRYFLSNSVASTEVQTMSFI